MSIYRNKTALAGQAIFDLVLHSTPNFLGCFASEEIVACLSLAAYSKIDLGWLEAHYSSVNGIDRCRRNGRSESRAQLVFNQGRPGNKGKSQELESRLRFKCGLINV